MEEEVQMILEEAKEAMDAAVKHLEKELVKIRAGKANPVMLNSVYVMAYGSKMPINQVASVSTLDARTISVTPFDKSTLGAIERGIVEANLGLNPQNDGTVIRVPIPMLTEERRKDLVKQAKAEGEDAKISLRNSRRDANESLKKAKNDGLSEDQAKRGEDAVNKITSEYGDKIDQILKVKEEDIMTV